MSINADTIRFLKEIFRDKPDQSKIVIWTLPNRACRFLDTPEEAASAAMDASDGNDVYFGAGLMKRALSGQQRGTKKEVAAITSLWTDIDVAGAGHKDTKKNLFSTIGAAEEFLAKLLIEPSAVIHSGGGLQAYWFLKEPLIFNDDKDWQDGERLCLNWTRTVQSHAVAAGNDIDSTFDITRVMRVPGTFNRKADPARPVKLLRINDLRYDPGDFESLFVDPLFASKPAADLDQIEIIKAHGLTLNPKAEPSLDKMEALSDAEPRFKASWDRNRKDMRDQSASAYDLSLATFAAAAEWTDQEIADLLIASRRKHKDDLKLRADYYARTIARAKQTSKRATAVDNLQAVIETRQQLEKPPASSNGNGAHPEITPAAAKETRARILQGVSDAMETKIVSIIKYHQDPPKYRIVTEKGEIDLGTVDHLISQSSLRSALAASDGHYIRKFPSADWDALAQSLLDACEIVYTGEEGTDIGAMRSWLERYIDENPPSEISAATIANAVPLFEGKFVYIFLSHFREWLYRREQEKITGKAAGILLRRVGGTPDIIGHVDEGTKKATTRSVWQLPYDRQRGSIGGQRKARLEVRTPEIKAAAVKSDDDDAAPF